MIIPFDEVVSLGRACQPAYQIRRVTGAQTAHVFDWIITPDAALRTLVESRLQGFFARERLQMGPEECVVDAVSDVRFQHEFPPGADIDAKHAEHAPRFAALVARWRELSASRRRVLFIRQHAWDPDPRETAQRLRRALDLAAPALAYTLLYLTETETPPWGEARIVNRHLRQPAPYDWRGDDQAWSELLAEFATSPASRSGVET